MTFLTIMLAVLIVLGLYFYFRIYTYKRYPLKADKSRFPHVKTQADIEQLTRELVSKMSLDEKIAQMHGVKYRDMFRFAVNLFKLKRFIHLYAAGNERLGIPPFVLSDGPRGARVTDGQHAGVTTFPVGIARGASWDVALEARVHDVIGKEMRAVGTNMAATPCMNLIRHPGWGRAQESYSEDPWHTGQFAVVATQAIQAHNVMASPKHFALNSIENSRFVVSVELDDRALHEVYLPHFKKVVQEGEAVSLMTAYNQARGEYLSQNKHFLTDILRNDWGFKGFLHSDWFFAMHDAAPSIQAGLNIEMPAQKVYTNKAIKSALADGEIRETDLDKLIVESLQVRLEYAFADDAMDYSKSLLACPEHVALAREAAEKSMVLIKNDQVLPFSKDGGKTIAVIGRLANVENTGDQGSSDCSSPYVITPYEGLKRYHGELGNQVVLDDGSDLIRARQLAESADEVIVVAGYTYLDEGEYLLMSESANESARAGKQIGKKGDGGDRESLALKVEDEQLIDSLAGSNDKLVVALVCGSAVDVSAWDHKVPAILYAWYAGMEGGTALASVLYGDVNPSGKLPLAIPKSSQDYPYFTPYTAKINYDYYHGYTLFDKQEIDVAYPFGFGLSYTRYDYQNLQVLTPQIGEQETLEVQVDVTNSGTTSGEEIVQLYVGFAHSAVDRPVKILRAFDKVQLDAGETKTVSLAVSAADLAWYNPDEKAWQIENMAYEVYVGSSSAMKDLLRADFEIK